MNRKNVDRQVAGHVWRSIVFTMPLATGSIIHAATIWNGPRVTYSQPSADPTQASNQDRIMPDVWLTRAASKGLFNAFYETNATAFSPTNTEWAFGSLTNYASLHYTNWLAWLNGASPATLVGQPAIVHLISDDIYVSLEFTVWVPGGSGGFAFQRSTPPLVNLSDASVNNGRFYFSYPNDAGFSYVVQSSTNLVNWVSLATNPASDSLVLFSNSVDPGGIRFYRVSRFQTP